MQWSTDGIHFNRAAKTDQPVLTGCGPFDPDAFKNDGWGAVVMLKEPSYET
jgi:hypothetical protein